MRRRPSLEEALPLVRAVDTSRHVPGVHNGSSKLVADYERRSSAIRRARLTSAHRKGHVAQPAGWHRADGYQSDEEAWSATVAMIMARDPVEVGTMLMFCPVRKVTFVCQVRSLVEEELGG